MGRLVTAVLAVGLFLPLAGTASVGTADRRVATDPIVGLWERSDGRQTRVDPSGAGFTGQIVRQSTSCFPPGTTVWRMQGSGGRYTGETLYRSTSSCADTGWGRSDWTLEGANTLRHCGADPAGGNYGCVTYSRVKPKDTRAPFVKALNVTGTTGRVVRLLYRVSDDSGRAAVRISVVQGSTRIFGPTQLAMQAVSPDATYGYPWVIPRTGTGQFRFAVQAVDEAGNWTGMSYALIALSDGVRVPCAGNGTVIAGTAGDDVLTGTPGTDTICGGPGDDEITGLGGGDQLYGGEGDDTLDGGAGNDWLRGEEGSDRHFGGSGDDNLEDHQPLSEDHDEFNGGPGNDYALVTARFDRTPVSVERVRICGNIHAGARPPDCRDRP